MAVDAGKPERQSCAHATQSPPTRSGGGGADVKIGLAVDPTCDLPLAFLEKHDVTVLPGRIRFGDLESLDRRDPRETMGFYRRYVADRSADVATGPVAADELRELFLQRLVTRHDRVLVLCRSTARGGSFERATQASYGVLKRYRDIRRQAGLDPAFALRVVDLGCVGPGEGVVAHYAVRRIESSPPFDALRRAVEEAGSRTMTWLVPQDSAYLRRPAGRHPPLHPGGWRYLGSRLSGRLPVLALHHGQARAGALMADFQAGVEYVFERAREAVGAGLSVSAIVMSFGGDPRIIRNLAAYQAFEGFAADRKLDLQLSVMSASLAVQVGPGAFAAAWTAGD